METIVQDLKVFTADHAMLVMDMIILGYTVEDSAMALGNQPETTFFFSRQYNKPFALVGTKFYMEHNGTSVEINKDAIQPQLDDKRRYNRFGNKI